MIYNLLGEHLAENEGYSQIPFTHDPFLIVLKIPVWWLPYKTPFTRVVHETVSNFKNLRLGHQSEVKDDFFFGQTAHLSTGLHILITYVPCFDYGGHAAVFDTIVCNVMVDGSGWLSGFFHAVWTTVLEKQQTWPSSLLAYCTTYTARLMLVKTLWSALNISLICGR